ncbi:hypothetical protein Areg01_27090 [Actinoplanes regularis]|nr:hypothetical protein Areg01_27090 [Actinoplanes regularis]
MRGLVPARSASSPINMHPTLRLNTNVKATPRNPPPAKPHPHSPQTPPPQSANTTPAVRKHHPCSSRNAAGEERGGFLPPTVFGRQKTTSLLTGYKAFCARSEAKPSQLSQTITPFCARSEAEPS